MHLTEIHEMNISSPVHSSSVTVFIPPLSESPSHGSLQPILSPRAGQRRLRTENQTINCSYTHQNKKIGEDSEIIEIQERFNNIDPHWIHKIIEKDPRYWRNTHTFEDGIEWSISGSSNEKLNWNPDDLILITYDPEGGYDQWEYYDEDCVRGSYQRRDVWEFFNITQNQTARGNCWYFNRDAENLAKVSAFTDYYNTVILSNGLVLSLVEQDKDKLPIFVNWKKDDIVTTIQRKGSDLYGLWNHSRGMVFDLKIQ